MSRLLRLHDLIQHDHKLEAELVAHLGEVDARRLYLEQACSSMFRYCVHVLHFAEAVAYKRIGVARAARKFPALLAALEKGELHLTGASLIALHLEDGSAAEWVAIARHATAQEIKQRLADRQPKPDVRTSLRRSPTPRLAKSDAAKRGESTPSTPESKPPTTTTSPASAVKKNQARCEPLGAERYCIRFVADRVVHEQLQDLRALLRHSIPDGDLAKILARAAAMSRGRVGDAEPGSTWSFTIRYPGLAVGSTLPQISVCAAAPTINSRPSWLLASSQWLSSETARPRAVPGRPESQLDLNPVGVPS